METDLAQAVFERWEEGLPVYEGTLYKAAAALGMDPEAVLAEARFYTHLDHFLLEKRAMTFHEKAYFSTAAGVDPVGLVKTANTHNIPHEDLILVTLRDRNFTPDIAKLAFLGMQGGPTEGPAMASGDAATPNPGQGGPGEYASAPVEPQPGKQVQQQPDARQMALQGGPTAPQQIPPSDGGNLSELLQGAQQADAAPMGGGLPPSGMGAQETPPPLSAEDKLQQAFGGQLDPDSLSRYAPKLDEFENQIGMTIQDPKQIEKFVKELQKGEKKMVDEAIKQYGAQQAQEQQAASGMGGPGGAGGMMGGASTATFDPTAPKPKKPGGAAPAGGAAPPKKEDDQADPSQQAQAMSKVASAARALARSQLR